FAAATCQKRDLPKRTLRLTLQSPLRWIALLRFSGGGAKLLRSEFFHKAYRRTLRNSLRPTWNFTSIGRQSGLSISWLNLTFSSWREAHSASWPASCPRA